MAEFGYAAFSNRRLQGRSPEKAMQASAREEEDGETR
jgi:hypothetical protein